MYICNNCDYGSASWIGRCPNCGEWNSLVEQKTTISTSTSTEKLNLIPLNKIKPLKKDRIKTGVFEFDRVLGNGFITGEVILLAGEPGVGKSTLLLQSLGKLSTLYVSGEESAEQLKERASRLKINLDNLAFSDTLQVEAIIEGIENLNQKPEVVVVDSIQTIYSKNVDSPFGSVGQLKETTNNLVAFAKKNKITVVMIGHITKEGDIAGPKTLEHLVDCVLNFEGEKVSNFRILRSSKNRFGSTDEIGIFEMIESGLRGIDKPTVFLDRETGITTGKTVVAVAEGKRPLFFEVQALAVPTVLAVPRRVVKGLDYNKVLLLLAVIRKHLHYSLDKFDIYINVVGGVDIKSPASDLGVIAAIVSSVGNFAIPKKTVFIGEVGLLGEVRRVYFEEKIIYETRRLKFQNIISPLTIRNIRELKRLLNF